METLIWILIFTLINGLLAFVGALSFLLSKKSLNKIIPFLVAFAIGALLGGALFHFIPEAIEELKLIWTVLLAALGFGLFYLIERFLHWHHCKHGECPKHHFTYLILIGDGVHNFIDGLIIAASFIISIPIGIISSIIILLHELPQEIGDFGVLIHGGFSRTKALVYNFLSQLTAVLGGVLGFYLIGLQEQAIYLLPIAAGGFLYIALVDLIPEVFKEKNKMQAVLNVLLILLGMGILMSGKVLGG